MHEVFRRREAAFVAAVMLGCLTVGGCQETAGVPGSALAPPAASTPLVSAPGAPVAFTSIDGLPETEVATFRSALAQQAGARRIDVVEGEAPAADDQARFLLRGYLSAYPEDGRTTVAYVWDVFDTTKKRSHRVEGAVATAARGPADDPWQGVDRRAMDRVASASMNELAAFLASAPPPAPVAVAARKSAPTAVAARSKGQAVAAGSSDEGSSSHARHAARAEAAAPALRASLADDPPVAR